MSVMGLTVSTTLTERLTMFTLYYKTEDNAPWKVEGSYDSESKAQANAWELLTDGYIIKVEEE